MIPGGGFALKPRDQPWELVCNLSEATTDVVSVFVPFSTWCYTQERNGGF